MKGKTQPLILSGAIFWMPRCAVWHDWSLALAVRYGVVCYLGEIVEARQDTSVVIHPLTDERRMLRLGECNEKERKYHEESFVSYSLRCLNCYKFFDDVDSRFGRNF